MSAKVVALLGILVLAGCGMFVPQIRDFPNNGSEAENNTLVQAIIRSIHCELEDAVTRVINAGIDTARANPYAGRAGVNIFFYKKFLKDWGAEVGLSRTRRRISIAPRSPSGRNFSSLLSR